MSDFLKGLGYGLCNNRYSFGSLLFDGYRRGALYNISQSPLYMSSCYADLDSPSGLSSVLDGGYAINAPYYGNGFTGYTLGGCIPLVTCDPYAFGGYRGGFGFGLGMGLGFGGFCYC